LRDNAFENVRTERPEMPCYVGCKSPPAYSKYKRRINMQIKTFPLDCTMDCLHYKRWDMSIDDWTSYCDLLKELVDDCDVDIISYRCPLEEKK